MARNATTFPKGTHGGAKGAGWGGPAKGAGQPFSPEYQPAIEALREGHAQGFTFRRLAASHKLEAFASMIAMMRDPETPPPTRDSILTKILAYAGEPLTTKQEVETNNVHRVISEKPLTEEQWEQVYGPKDDDAVG